MGRACDRAGLARCAHRLRHALATEMLRAGASRPRSGRFSVAVEAVSRWLSPRCPTRRQAANSVRLSAAGILGSRPSTFTGVGGPRWSNRRATSDCTRAGGGHLLRFHLRRYRTESSRSPSRGAVRRIRRRLRTELRALRGSNAGGVLKKLTPIIRGWAAYYRTEVSSEVFSALDDYMWKLTYRWARHRHPKKSRWWVVDRYYGQFHPTKRNRWVFGDRDSGAYLPKFAWTKIVRHAMVAGAASPDDPALADYWAQRRRKQAPPPLSAPVRHLLGVQQGRCTACGGLLLHADHHPHSPQQWAQWVRVTLVAIRKQHIAATTNGGSDDRRLIHSFCRRRTEPAQPKDQ